MDYKCCRAVFFGIHAVPTRTKRKDLSLLKGWVSDPTAIGVVGLITEISEGLRKAVKC